MNTKEAITTWIEALRSGRFIQGQEAMATVCAGHYELCCLGVACDIGGLEIVEADEDSVSFLNAFSMSFSMSEDGRGEEDLLTEAIFTDNYRNGESELVDALKPLLTSALTETASKLAYDLRPDPGNVAYLEDEELFEKALIGFNDDLCLDFDSIATVIEAQARELELI